METLAPTYAASPTLASVNQFDIPPIRKMLLEDAAHEENDSITQTNSTGTQEGIMSASNSTKQSRYSSYIKRSLKLNATHNKNSGSPRYAMPKDVRVESIEQFVKTKLCPHMHKVEGCRRFAESSCPYAHNETELRPMPNLRKTAMCQNHLKGECKEDASNCFYAHSFEELRHTEGFYKTTVCKFWLKGSCRAGVSCRHAHGTKDIRIKAKDRYDNSDEEYADTLSAEYSRMDRIDELEESICSQDFSTQDSPDDRLNGTSSETPTISLLVDGSRSSRVLSTEVGMREDYQDLNRYRKTIISPHHSCKDSYGATVQRSISVKSNNCKPEPSKTNDIATHLAQSYASGAQASNCFDAAEDVETDTFISNGISKHTRTSNHYGGSSRMHGSPVTADVWVTVSGADFDSDETNYQFIQSPSSDCIEHSYPDTMNDGVNTFCGNICNEYEVEAKSFNNHMLIVNGETSEFQTAVSYHPNDSSGYQFSAPPAVYQTSGLRETEHQETSRTIFRTPPSSEAHLYTIWPHQSCSPTSCRHTSSPIKLADRQGTPTCLTSAYPSRYRQCIETYCCCCQSKSTIKESEFEEPVCKGTPDMQSVAPTPMLVRGCGPITSVPSTPYTLHTASSQKYMGEYAGHDFEASNYQLSNIARNFNAIDTRLHYDVDCTRSVVSAPAIHDYYPIVSYITTAPLECPLDASSNASSINFENTRNMNVNQRDYFVRQNAKAQSIQRNWSCVGYGEGADSSILYNSYHDDSMGDENKENIYHMENRQNAVLPHKQEVTSMTVKREDHRMMQHQMVYVVDRNSRFNSFGFPMTHDQSINTNFAFRVTYEE